MSNHFLVSWTGSKRREINDIIPYFNLDNIDTIIEPYCGSSAISVHLSEKEQKFKYILNDNDEKLISLYHIIKDYNELQYIEDEMNKILKGDIDEKTYYEILAKDTILSFILARTIYYARIGYYNSDKRQPKKVNFTDKKITKFMREEDVQLYNIDAIDIIKNNIDNEKALIYIDPPYLKTRNKDFYSNIKNVKKLKDVFIYLSTLKDIKCKIYLNILYNEELDTLLTNFKTIHIYNKRYCFTKSNKPIQHILYEFNA